ncbi:hypothetical protein KIPB_004634 [Kipferlia bialata]|uniref:Aldehyde dehydrogenase domain-containing protein n=1 Tax=Kipferlia bialata TaxID=797122 RepID=A0A9K3CVT9_9EUKA|nr:hypothetical protein KIPB_004634 [Kipferlia bialata]|eukprot:g4634.t1
MSSVTPVNAFEWSTFDPSGKTHVMKNLVNGEWHATKTTGSLLNPLTGEEDYILYPETTMEEAQVFVESLKKCPKSGLHNPLKNPKRYRDWGAITFKVATEIRKPEVSDYFARIIQAVCPKSYTQAIGEVNVVATFLENFCGDQVRFLGGGEHVPGDRVGQQANGYRWPFGPVAIVAPFNFPLEIPVLQLMGALYMGNKVLLKAATTTAVVMEQYLRLLLWAGCPHECLDFINTRGSWVIGKGSRRRMPTLTTLCLLFIALLVSGVACDAGEMRAREKGRQPTHHSGQRLGPGGVSHEESGLSLEDSIQDTLDAMDVKARNYCSYNYRITFNYARDSDPDDTFHPSRNDYQSWQSGCGTSSVSYGQSTTPKQYKGYSPYYGTVSFKIGCWQSYTSSRDVVSAWSVTHETDPPTDQYGELTLPHALLRIDNPEEETVFLTYSSGYGDNCTGCNVGDGSTINLSLYTPYSGSTDYAVTAKDASGSVLGVYEGALSDEDDVTLELSGSTATLTVQGVAGLEDLRMLVQDTSTGLLVVEEYLLDDYTWGEDISVTLPYDVEYTVMVRSQTDTVFTRYQTVTLDEDGTTVVFGSHLIDLDSTDMVQPLRLTLYSDTLQSQVFEHYYSAGTLHSVPVLEGPFFYELAWLSDSSVGETMTYEYTHECWDYMDAADCAITEHMCQVSFDASTLGVAAPESISVLYEGSGVYGQGLDGYDSHSVVVSEYSVSGMDTTPLTVLRGTYDIIMHYVDGTLLVSDAGLCTVDSAVTTVDLVDIFEAHVLPLPSGVSSSSLTSIDVSETTPSSDPPATIHLSSASAAYTAVTDGVYLPSGHVYQAVYTSSSGTSTQSNIMYTVPSAPVNTVQMGFGTYATACDTDMTVQSSLGGVAGYLYAESGYALAGNGVADQAAIASYPWNTGCVLVWDDTLDTPDWVGHTPHTLESCTPLDVTVETDVTVTGSGGATLSVTVYTPSAGQRVLVSLTGATKPEAQVGAAV